MRCSSSAANISYRTTLGKVDRNIILEKLPTAHDAVFFNSYTATGHTRLPTDQQMLMGLHSPSWLIWLEDPEKGSYVRPRISQPKGSGCQPAAKQDHVYVTFVRSDPPRSNGTTPSWWLLVGWKWPLHGLLGNHWCFERWVRADGRRSA